jgi:membrane associated rhomboid family serine protease
MFPIRDTIQSKNYAVVNNTLIAINVLIFLVELFKGTGLDNFIFTYGLVPARYSIPQIGNYFSPAQQIFALFTFMFLHGGFWHLLGNMWFLYIFGDNVEDRLGHVRYLAFYILCGLLSGLFHLAVNWTSQVPTIGASGAIAGVMGAYIILYPRSKILTLIPIIIIPYFIEIPAVIFLGIWFAFQFLGAAGSSAQAGGIAWWAHVAGFLAGMGLLKLFLALPEFGISKSMREITSKRKTPRFQVIHPTSSKTAPHLNGIISITPREALLGAVKLVNIPWGLQRRLFKVTIPPGVRDGTVLRLKGMGNEMFSGLKGDLYLTVSIR